MHRSLLISLLLLPLAANLACGDEPVCGSFPLDPATRTCITDRIGTMVADDYPFAELKGVDLAAFDAALAGLPAEGDDVDYLRAVERTVATLQDGHTRLDWEDPRFAAFPPVRWRLIGDGIYVAAAGEGLPLRPGDRLLTVEGRPAADLLEELATQVEATTSNVARRLILPGLLAGPVGTTVDATVEGRGTVTLTRQATRGGSPLPLASRRWGKVGYLRLPTLAYLDDVDTFDRALNDLADCAALIIDLRGNGGGKSGIADAMLGRLLPDPGPPFPMVDREGREKRTIGPSVRGELYENPLVVLTDERTYSAANYFVQQLQYHGRATIIGETTGGGAGSPETRVELVPDVSFQVSTTAIETPEGASAEQGITPDVPVLFTPEDLAQGLDTVRGDPAHDKVLATALAYLQETAG